MLETTSSSVMNFLIKIAYFAASHVEMYSTLVVESTVTFYLEPFQLIPP